MIQTFLLPELLQITRHIKVPPRELKKTYTIKELELFYV